MITTLILSTALALTPQEAQVEHLQAKAKAAQLEVCVEFSKLAKLFHEARYSGVSNTRIIEIATGHSSIAKAVALDIIASPKVTSSSILRQREALGDHIFAKCVAEEMWEMM